MTSTVRKFEIHMGRFTLPFPNVSAAYIVTRRRGKTNARLLQDQHSRVPLQVMTETVVVGPLKKNDVIEFVTTDRHVFPCLVTALDGGQIGLFQYATTIQATSAARALRGEEARFENVYPRWRATDFENAPSWHEFKTDLAGLNWKGARGDV